MKGNILNTSDELEDVFASLREVFEAQMACLKDHEDFSEIGEGKIKMFVKPTMFDSTES